MLSLNLMPSSEARESAHVHAHLCKLPKFGNSVVPWLHSHEEFKMIWKDIVMKTDFITIHEYFS